MKKDRLERFVRDNREAFDSHEPSPDLWARLDHRLGEHASPLNGTATPLNGHALTEIENVLPLQSRTSPFQRFSFIWKTACVLIITGLMGWWLLNFRAGEASGENEMARIDPKAAQAAFHYTSLIEIKRAEIKQVALTDPHLYREFSSEIEGLDQDYQRLKAELPQTPNQEELLQAMIGNLQSQVDILNRQLSIIQRISNAKQNHETTL